MAGKRRAQIKSAGWADGLKQCKCIDRMNRSLAPRNAELDTVSVIGWGRLPTLATRKLNPRVDKHAAAPTPTFCPFCGKEYARFEDTKTK